MTLPAHLDGLNPEQAEAVTWGEGPLLILAGAGSGKTRVLTRRIAHLLYQGVRPEEILAVTFTNKAAGEMRERVGSLVGDRASRVLVSTFHSACARFLRRDAPRLGYTSSFVIYDDDDQIRLLREILKDLKLDPKRYPPGTYRARFDQAKNRLASPLDLLSPGELKVLAAFKIQEVWTRYEAALRTANALDFNDLVGHMVALLEGDAELRTRYHDRFRYLLVDEYQDTNHAQYRLVKALAAGHRNVAVVGDDDQSIYAFRGADIRNILDFEKDFPEARVVRLERNYRSTGNILKAAGAMVRRNRDRKEKTLWTDAPDGDLVRAITGADEDEEALKVVAEIRRLLAEGRRPGDVAVFYRVHALSRPLEQALADARIPYVVVGGRRFFERREVRDVIAWLRLLANPADDMAFLRVVNTPPRGIGDRTVGLVREEAARDGVPLLEAARRFARGGGGRAATAVAAFLAIVDHLADTARLEPTGDLVLRAAEASGTLPALRADDTLESRGRIENIESLAVLGQRVAKGLPPETDAMGALQAFLEQATLAGQDEEIPADQGAVTLMTVHLAKGLEYPVVFVVGMAEQVFPHARSLETAAELEEERRLAYVAFTRARERLYLCRPRRRLVRTEGFLRPVPARPSPFLLEVPPDLVDAPIRPVRRPGTPLPPAALGRMEAFLERVRAQPARTPGPEPVRRTIVPEDPDLFRVGTRVRHPVFGAGDVRAREGAGPSLKLRIFFPRFGLKAIRASDSRLEVLHD